MYSKSYLNNVLSIIDWLCSTFSSLFFLAYNSNPHVNYWFKQHWCWAFYICTTNRKCLLVHQCNAKEVM